MIVRKLARKPLLFQMRDWTIVAIVFFCAMLTVYISIPDYPYSAHPWEIMLWGEQTQWWSEVTWIIFFGLSSIIALLCASWSHYLPSTHQIRRAQMLVRGSCATAFMVIATAFSVEHFTWTGWHETFILDSGGFLHGFFYILTATVTLLALEEFMAFMAKLRLQAHKRWRVVRSVRADSRGG